MSNGSSEVKIEVIKGVFDLLRNPLVIVGLLVGMGMYTGVLTKENVESVAAKAIQLVKE